MKFKYKYEKLLKLKINEKNLKAVEYSNAKNEVLKIEKKIEEHKANIQKIIEEKRRNIESYIYDTKNFQIMSEFIVGEKERIENKNQEKIPKVKVEQEKHNEMVELIRSVKTYEKIKENDYIKFKKNRNKKEQKTIDDLVLKQF